MLLPLIVCTREDIGGDMVRREGGGWTSQDLTWGDLACLLPHSIIDICYMAR